MEWDKLNHWIPTFCAFVKNAYVLELKSDRKNCQRSSLVIFIIRSMSEELGVAATLHGARRSLISAGVLTLWRYLWTAPHPPPPLGLGRAPSLFSERLLLQCRTPSGPSPSSASLRCRATRYVAPRRVGPRRDREASRRRDVPWRDAVVWRARLGWATLGPLLSRLIELKTTGIRIVSEPAASVMWQGRVVWRGAVGLPRSGTEAGQRVPMPGRRGPAWPQPHPHRRAGCRRRGGAWRHGKWNEMPRVVKWLVYCNRRRRRFLILKIMPPFSGARST